ncbi:glycosyltransferase family 4 protein [Alkalihalobacillus oceani]|uniref:glycosyltransferase family 4 protein n=1 Tax=Halalkalibacter oceani TaxID=1653776 RepID=UPI00203C575A|nr:glycosyltransferase family 4 protein [Halalkalibacter oceani]MCM3761881.1 glycosyltransferase family 4 protein [Halalkalibacter oceani]
MKAKRVLVLTHHGGGGVRLFRQQWALEHDAELLILYVREQKLILTEGETESEWPLTVLDSPAFLQRLKCSPVEAVMIDHVWGFPLERLLSFLELFRQPYDLHIHDYLAACPQLFFITPKGHYCGQEKEVRICRHCSKAGIGRRLIEEMVGRACSIDEWRRWQLALLQKARRIIVPSYSAKEVMQGYFPGLNYEVQPHPVHRRQLNNDEAKRSGELRIGIVGHMAVHKGSREVLELIGKLERRRLPVKLFLYGNADHLLAKKASPVFIQRGEFQRDQLPVLLAADQIDLVLIPSICPETFSYTTHEALSSGYPVLCFELGAQAEAVQKVEGGWAVTPFHAEALYQKIAGLVRQPEEVLEAASRLQESGRAEDS